MISSGVQKLYEAEQLQEFLWAAHDLNALCTDTSTTLRIAVEDSGLRETQRLLKKHNLVQRNFFAGAATLDQLGLVTS